jgi:hypothetical protein
LLIARGGSDSNTIWNYDGAERPTAGAGRFAGLPDFDAFEELQIYRRQRSFDLTGGVVVNIVTKRR